MKKYVVNLFKITARKVQNKYMMYRIHRLEKKYSFNFFFMDLIQACTENFFCLNFNEARFNGILWYEGLLSDSRVFESRRR